MRPPLPLLCGLVAAVALSPGAWAEDTAFLIHSITVEASAGPQAPPAAPPAVAGETAAGVVQAAAPDPSVAPAVETDPEQKKAQVLRGSLFMLILPNLCCRY